LLYEFGGVGRRTGRVAAVVLDEQLDAPAVDATPIVDTLEVDVDRVEDRGIDGGVWATQRRGDADVQHFCRTHARGVGTAGHEHAAEHERN
jgi:hypothetical protein